ncbi:TrmH family RNA methyltransferase [Amycolatopsis benzoatilytica]|uniref:TrmH family RNA methyltransferase n=1 Tax=Amycolatopsis benzoatilytica TaxID=346045 RepID=UPI000370933A|nr:RNA methyltransferase [Amycolatopsis benzoatilytica]
MAELIFTEDRDHPGLDDFRDLSTADRRPDRPGGRGLVIAEGTVVVSRLLASRYPVRALLGVERRLRELEDELAGFAVPAYVTSAETMADVVGFHLNRGVLAVADRPTPPTVVEIVEGAQVLAVLEGVGDHENLGAIFRNAAALGVDGVLLGRGCSDPLYRRSVRVSMGHVLRVPFATFDSWPGGLDVLRARGFSVAALTPRADSVPLRGFRDRVPGPIALLLGAEGPGLTEEAIAAADVAVRIEMVPGVDSLNVATAAAIAFHEVAAGSSALE